MNKLLTGLIASTFLMTGAALLLLVDHRAFESVCAFALELIGDCCEQAIA